MQSELDQRELEKLQIAAAVEQAQAAHAQLAAELQDKMAALAEAQQQAEQGSALAAAREIENKSLLQDVYQMQSELDQRELEKMQHAAAVEQAQAAHAQLAAELQDKIVALAEAQQQAEQGSAQTVQLEGENDLLLLQLHQAQDDLDQHAQQNRQLHEVMGQSRQSLDRARHLISRLMLPTRGVGEAMPVAQAAQAA